jgi:hypothetical protein
MAFVGLHPRSPYLVDSEQEVHMRKRTHLLFGALALMMATTLMVTSTVEAKRGGEGGRGDGPIVYVMEQGLYYDSIVTADPLPPHGPFQQLFPPDGNDDRLRTQYGPGDPGYLGGRWWVDTDGDGEMNAGDHFFMCPLQGPGREAP